MTNQKMTKVMIDTHAWIWAWQNPSRLSPAAREILGEVRYDDLLLSAISIWEFSLLLQKRRLSVGIDGYQWIQNALKMPRLRLVPLTPEVSWEASRLPTPFHADPADRFIVATARLEGATLLTVDRQIRGYSFVKALW